MLLKGFCKILSPLGENDAFRFLLFVIAAKPLKSADFGLFFDFACFHASFDVFCMRWDVRNIILEVQTMGSEGLQACKHQIFIFYGHFGAKNHCCTVYTGISRFSIFEEV